MLFIASRSSHSHLMTLPRVGNQTYVHHVSHSTGLVLQSRFDRVSYHPFSLGIVSPEEALMKQPVPISPDHWYTRLKLHTNDTSTNTITCDDLGLHYRISTRAKPGSSNVLVTSFFRNHRANREWGVLVAEWERRVLSTDRIRMAPSLEVNAYGPEVSFVSINMFLRETDFWSFK